MKERDEEKKEQQQQQCLVQFNEYCTP